MQEGCREGQREGEREGGNYRSRNFIILTPLSIIKVNKSLGLRGAGMYNSW
jgi:hypothetical protein